MKQIIITITALALLSGVTGCQMFNGSEREESSIRSDAELISYVASALHLQSNPDDRSKFEMARATLDLIVVDEDLTSEELNVALSQLPISELRSGNGAILFNAGLILLQRFGDVAPSQLLSDEVRSVAIGVRDGISRALGPIQTPAG